VCGVYREAPSRVMVGERVLSTDEMTGVQALERAAPGLPPRPGKVERREFEYIRHGTLSFKPGSPVRPCGPNRTRVAFRSLQVPGQHSRSGRAGGGRNQLVWHR
jgi:hypothetical protein